MVKNNYLERCTDEKLRQKLARISKRDLERLLDFRVGEFQKIPPQIQTPQKFERNVSVKELPCVLKKMKRNIGSFLAASGVAPCFIKYYTPFFDRPNAEYDEKKRIIKVSKEYESTLMGLIAHEYTHHLQDLFLGSLNNNFPQSHIIFAEGHAEGVAKSVLVNLARKHNEPSITVWSKSRIIQAIKKVKDQKLISQHEEGFALFSYLEQKDGPGIYKAMLQGEYDW